MLTLSILNLITEKKMQMVVSFLCALPGSLLTRMLAVVVYVINEKYSFFICLCTSNVILVDVSVIQLR